MLNRRFHGGIATAALLGAAACAAGDQAPRDSPDLLVVVRNGAISAPDSVTPGWTRLRVDEDGAGHIVVLFRLADAADTSHAVFVAALDTARATPGSAVALGGPEIGDTGDVHVELTPGRYVLGCVRRGDDGHRHAVNGEVKPLVVTSTPVAASRVAAPVATADVPMTDFAYVGAERWATGAQLLRVENRGGQDHQLRIARLREGSSVKQWLNADEPDDHVTPIAGVARMSPGVVAYLPVELPRGEYVIYCLVADKASGKPHVELGMFRAIHVD